jgi:hypothetical protein
MVFLAVKIIPWLMDKNPFVFLPGLYLFLSCMISKNTKQSWRWAKAKSMFNQTDIIGVVTRRDSVK